MARQYYVYVMTNESRTLYAGVTNDLMRRVEEHKGGQVPGFTARYGLKKLVYYETAPNAYDAIAREKQIKAWTRAKRLALIASINPNWDYLSAAWADSPVPAQPTAGAQDATMSPGAEQGVRGEVGTQSPRAQRGVRAMGQRCGSFANQNVVREADSSLRSE